MLVTLSQARWAVPREFFQLKIRDFGEVSVYFAHYVGDIVPSKMGCPKGVLAA